jgi:LemA protein
MGWIIGGVVAVLVIAAILYFNSLVRLRNRVENGWAQIGVQLKRRLDLIPNLVETVRGYANFEKSALEAVITARQGALSAAPTPPAQAGADNALTGALRQFFALSEAYPDLKANQNFLALQEELTATEGRVAYARQFYNDEVLRYDTAIEKFPGLIFARIFGFGPKEYFEAEPEASSAPRVQF